MMSSRIIAEIDYEKDGKQVGWLGLPSRAPPTVRS
jgi:hypothetical protein